MSEIAIFTNYDCPGAVDVLRTHDIKRQEHL